MNRFRHLLSVIFAVATMLSAMHHHKDFKPHNDCQICTLQYNISSGDTPSEPVYLQEISNFSSPVVAELFSLHVSIVNSTNSARAPPFYS